MRDLRYGAMAFRPDARRLAISAPNGELALWDTATPARPERAGRLRMRGGIVAAAWNPVATTMLATTTSDGTAAVWLVPDDRPPERVDGWIEPAGRPRFTGWVAEGRCLFSMTGDGHTTVWNLRTGDRIGQTNISDGRSVVAAYHRGDDVVAITSTGWARLWHPRRGPSHWIRLTGAPVSAATWSATLLVIGGPDGRVAGYDAGFRPVVSLRIARQPITALACSDGGRLVASSEDGSVTAVDLDGIFRWQTSLRAEPARSMAIAGDLVAVGGRPAMPRLLALPNGRAPG